MAKDRISIGIAPRRQVLDADDFVATDLTQSGADFAILDIVKAAGEPEAREVVCRGYFTQEQLVIKSATNAYCIIGAMAQVDWGSIGTSLTDTHGPLLDKVMEYAGYIGMKGIVASTANTSQHITGYARMLLAQLSNAGGMPVFARIQLLGPKDQAANAWECWNKVRCLCKHDPRLQLVLVLDVKPEDSIDMRQWYAEPVQIIEISTEMFISNKGNRPVLHKHHQRVMEKWMEFDVAFAVAGTNGKIAVSDCIHYLRYLAGRALELDPAEAASAEYYDILQAPLQPLMDNLDSVTYEVFEQDMSKYEAYEEAMFRAINDFHSTHNRRLVLMVVGAGRGPLVSRAIRAAQRNKADVKVYALEKNPSAFVELQRKNAMLWQNRVTLVHADMRQWEAPEMADILVSELLGSFGDNELSPECLDGAMRLLSLSGVCIPHRYTAYVAPMSSAVLFNRARGHGVEGKLETPFVVNIHAANILDEAQAVWSFEHGASSNSEQRQQHLETSDTSNIHNQRTSSSLFKIEQPSLVHGLAGYFDTELYKDVGLSIVPATHTEGMHSWFSMYFPIKQPLTVKSGDTVTVDMWRRTSGAKTWYEWAVSTSSGATSAIHNTNGHEFWIGQ